LGKAGANREMKLAATALLAFDPNVSAHKLTRR
jgi:hypothetical protein